MDDRKASKLTEKIFGVYEDVKASYKASKKRSHSDDKSTKEKDAKKPRIKDDEIKNDKLPLDNQLSADKVILICYYLQVFVKPQLREF